MSEARLNLLPITLKRAIPFVKQRERIAELEARVRSMKADAAHFNGAH